MLETIALIVIGILDTLLICAVLAINHSSDYQDKDRH